MHSIKACGLAAFALLSSCSLSVLADENLALNAGHEYMVTTNYPNNLHVIDLQTDTLYKTCKLADAFGPGTIQLSPDRKTAYVLNNHYADVYGVELDSCKQVFHASITQKPGEKAKSMFAFTLSHDGKAGVGGITETDATLAAASSAILVGFNVRADASARKVIEAESLEGRMHTLDKDFCGPTNFRGGGPTI